MFGGTDNKIASVRMAARTRKLVFNVLWSYVKNAVRSIPIILAQRSRQVLMTVLEEF
jgi:hypothetical protein